MDVSPDDREFVASVSDVVSFQPACPCVAEAAPSEAVLSVVFRRVAAGRAGEESGEVRGR